jgi:signal transduction histidine kinase
LLYFSDEDRYLHLGHVTLNILYIEKSVLFLAFGFYICFGQLFLNLPELYPRLNRFVKIAEYLIFSFCVLNISGLALSSAFVFHAKIYSIVFTLVFIFSMWLVGYFLFFQKYILSRVLVMAGVWIAVGTFVSMLVAWLNNDPLLANPDHMLFLQLGVLMELFIVNSALVYKVKIMQDDFNASQQLIIKELEENKKLNQRLNHIRDEISMDLHDEVGSGLSTIRLLTELIKRKSLNEDNSKPLSKISEFSKELVQKMNEIVWALNVGNDSLESLVAYIREYTMNFLDGANINCVFHVPEKIPEWQVEGHNRRAIFLIVKEALSNIIKHAEATEVDVELTVDKNLKILIHDNGKGLEFPFENFSHNGLHNMKRRTEALHGSIQFLNYKGTTVTLCITVESLLHESVI